MPRGRPLEVAEELIEAFERSGRVTELLVSRIPAGIWRSTPPSGRGRTIAAIVAHMQGVRRTFGRLGGASPEPIALDKDLVTRAQAVRALEASTRSLTRLFEEALSSKRARVKSMPRRAVDMIAYLIQHDAHHRGQISSLAMDLGFKMEQDDLMRIWGWKRLPPVRPSRSPVRARTRRPRAPRTRR